MLAQFTDRLPVALVQLVEQLSAAHSASALNTASICRRLMQPYGCMSSADFSFRASGFVSCHTLVPFFSCAVGLRSYPIFPRFGRYVFMRTPFGVLRVSTRARPRGGTPFSNNRFPLPSTTGATHMRYSSTRSAAISVCSNLPLPQICNSGPCDAFSRQTRPRHCRGCAASPSSRVCRACV